VELALIGPGDIYPVSLMSIAAGILHYVDADENVATRGHIFVLDGNALSLKTGPGEKTKRMTFRGLCRDIPDTKHDVRCSPDGAFEVVIMLR
jgi:hypothetical protein